MVQEIDFSSKHHILIQNSDGSLLPMDEPYFESEKIAPGTWKILGSGDYCYLVEGEREAIAIDTGYGAGNIRAYMQTLTDRPLRNVINTHDHFDHTANNAYFEKAYMSAETAPLATRPFPSFAGIDFHPTEYEKVLVDDGDILDLGGRTLEFFKIPDHAVGSIAMLDRKERFLFTGDEFMKMPLGKVLHVGVRSFFNNMEKLMPHRGEFSQLAAGGGVLPAELLDSYYACAAYILEGHEGDPLPPDEEPPKEPEHPADQIVYDRMIPHPEDRPPRKEPDPNVRCMLHAGVTIVYDLRKVNE